MNLFRLVAAFETATDYLTAHDEEVSVGGLFVRGAELPAGMPLSDCLLVVRIGGQDVREVPAKLASASPGVGATVIFLEAPTALLSLARELRASPTALGSEPRAKAVLRPVQSMAEKLELALHGDREQRMQALRDTNKQLHAVVLKNPRIGLEEVVWAAKQTTLNPDALKLIAEHPEWGQNPTVATALVRNPKTPVPVALRLLPRIPSAELKAIAKSTGRPQIVQGARKLLLR